MFCFASFCTQYLEISESKQKSFLQFLAGPSPLSTTFNHMPVGFLLTTPSADYSPILTLEATQALVQAIVISSLNYCNCLMAEVAKIHFRRLQSVSSRGSSTRPHHADLEWPSLATFTKRVVFKTTVIPIWTSMFHHGLLTHDIKEFHIPLACLAFGSLELWFPPHQLEHIVISSPHVLLSP